MTSIAFSSLFLGLVLGTNTVGAIVEGPVAAVESQLDGRRIARVEKAPWSSRIDLGRDLAPRELVARALDSSGEEVARARQWLNLPRRSAEAEIVLETDANGQAVAARLAWQSLLGSRPERVSVTFDGRSLPVDETRRVKLPAYDSRAPHLLTAELDFPNGVRSRTDMVVGGASSGYATSELTAVPIRIVGKKLPNVADLQDRFVKDSKPLRAAAVEYGPAQVLIVRDRGHGEAARVLGTSNLAAAERLRYEMRVRRGDRIRFVWPVPIRYTDAQISSDLFDSSRDFAREDGGLHWLLTRVYHPEGSLPQQRFTDAVATAGLQAFASGRRRAVVLVLGSRAADASTLSPEAVRSYLDKLRIPLHVWTLVEPASRPEIARWRNVEEVDSLWRLQRAFDRLEDDLDSQRVVWIEGKHLPQEIALSEKAAGIEIAR
jgi:hypothetical protein